MPFKRKVLIVDDSKINRLILHKILNDAYEIVEAQNGQQALDILLDTYQDISAILLDLLMPIMDGYEFLKHIRQNPNLATIPVIVTTGNDDQDAEVKALSLGAHDFLIKPYKPAIITHRLANTINLRENAALVNAVQKDKLTGLYNKEFFYQKISQCLQENPNQDFDIVCVDIERFKLINDLFGINTGDKLLKYVSSLLMDEAVEKIVIGRLGSDQFACLIPRRENYDNKGFQEFIDKVRAFEINLTINLCFGIYQITIPTPPVNVMCDRAIIACNSIKGRYDTHFAYYNDSFRQKLLDEQTIVDSMKEAIVKNQFVVYYQPKYDLKSETIAGGEALIRWHHPQKGFLSPNHFIPIFEKNGFITDLDIYVWTTVCKDLRSWLDAGYKIVPISVNVSRYDIYNSKLPSILANLIELYQIDPEYLHLEITETAYSDNPEQIITAVTKLRNIGFIIEMDDFGSGQSSLNMLSQLPINILKLDIGFIQNETKKKNKNILSFIISLAKWLDLLIIAEGVETVKQVTTLKNMDCNYVQGNYYAKPMTKKEFESHLITGTISKNQQLDKTPANEKRENEHIIVIIDENNSNCRLLSKILTDKYGISAFTNPSNGYHFIERNYDNLAAIILNNTLDLCKSLFEDERFQEIPIIILGPSNDATRWIKMGASEYLTLPLDCDIAKIRIENVIAAKQLKFLVHQQKIAEDTEITKYRIERDALTGLYNRFTIEKRFNNFINSSQKAECTFIMIDIDHFSDFKQKYGHERSDQLLLRITDILSKSFRYVDVIAHIEDDKFLIFVPQQIALTDLEIRVQKLQHCLTFNFYNQTITTSMGIVIAPLHGYDYATLYQHVNVALAMAKATGENQIKIYDTKMSENLLMSKGHSQLFLDSLNTNIMICSDNYEILYLNDAMLDLFNKKGQVYLKQPCYQFLWNRDQPCSHCHLNDANKLWFYDQQHSLLVANNQVNWHGHPARIEHIVTKKNLNKLNQVFSYGTFSKQVPFGMVKCLDDEQLLIVDANVSFYQMLGYHQDNFDPLYQQFLIKIITPDFLSQLKKMTLDHLIIINNHLIDGENRSIPVTSQIIKVKEFAQTYYYLTFFKTTKEGELK